MIRLTFLLFALFPLFLFSQDVDTLSIVKKIDSLSYISVETMKKGNYPDALADAKAAKALASQYLPRENKKYRVCLAILGKIYTILEDAQNGEVALLELKGILESLSEIDSTDYAQNLDNLGALYYQTGNYEKAEKYFLGAHQLWNQFNAPKPTLPATNHNNLGMLYLAYGEWDKSEIHFLKTKEMLFQFIGRKHAYSAQIMSNLGKVNFEMEQWDKAEAYFQESKNIIGEVYGEEHVLNALGLNNLGGLYKRLGDFEKAKEYAQQANDIMAKSYGREHPKFALGLNNLAEVYYQLGDLNGALKMAKEANEIDERILGEGHSQYAISLKLLSKIYEKKGEEALAIEHLLKANRLEKEYILNASRHLSNKELSSYKKRFVETFNQVLSLNKKYDRNDFNLASINYDNALYQKGFLLTAANQVKKLASNSEKSKKLHEDLQACHRKLAKEYTKPISQRTGVKGLENKANELEKDLVRAVSGYAEVFNQTSWQQVQAQLEEGEAAIEFVHYKSDELGKESPVFYAALLLKEGKEQVQMIALFEEKSLDSLLSRHKVRKLSYARELYSFADRGLVADKKTKSSLYDLIWKPLNEALKDIHTIYYAPSGLMHRLNLGAIPISQDSIIVDKYELVLLPSTRALVIKNLEDQGGYNNNAVLYGGIEYSEEENSISKKEAVETDKELVATNRNQAYRGGSWGYLKWTEKEVETIAGILEEGRVAVEKKNKLDASEDAFKKIGKEAASPRFLHLATHGFFFPEPKVVTVEEGQRKSTNLFQSSKQSMIRSGLILSNGNYAWEGNVVPENKEDGVLTAYEISQMDLSKTELVVLSACETGLGDIDGNEGVYGLQRAFKIAGAKYLIMSLWQVNDIHTQELMTLFYKNLLKENSTIPQAFKNAQMVMRDKFQNPFFWAGFVLLE